MLLPKDMLKKHDSNKVQYRSITGLWKLTLWLHQNTVWSCPAEQDKRSPNRPRLAGIRQINFAVNHTFEVLDRSFNHLGSFKMPDLV